MAAIIAICASTLPSAHAAIPYTEGVLSLTRPIVAKPVLQTPYVDEFGGTATRLSQSTDYVSHNEGYPLIKGEYARVPIENADGSKLLVYGVWEGNSNFITSYALMDSAGGAISLIEFESADNAAQFDRMHDEMEARWHPTDPDLIRFIGGGNSARGSLKVFEYRVSSGEITVLSDLSGKLPAHWGSGLYGMTHLEGGFSADGNRLAWAIEGANEEPVGFVVFDVRNDGVVLGTLDYNDQNHDNISITPSGNYAVISGSAETAAYTADFSEKRVLMEETQHGDTCTNALGHDCYVSVIFDDQSHAQLGKVFMTDLLTGEVESLIDVYGYGNTSLHLSGRAHDVPGWALMSTYNCLGNGVDTSTQPTSLCDRLTMVELAPNPRLYQIAWTHSSGETYNAEPHGTLSRDGLRAYFSSDWYSLKTADSDVIDLYRVDVSSELYDNLPVLPEPPSTPTGLLPVTGSTILEDESLALSWTDTSPTRTDSFVLVARDLQTQETISQTVLEQKDICDAGAECQYEIDTATLPSNTRISFALVANGLRGSSDWLMAEYVFLSSLTADAPEIVAPYSGVMIDTGIAPLFRWNQKQHPNAVNSFEIQIEDTITSTVFLHLANYSAPANCSDNTCSMIDRSLVLPESNGYQFRVRALNSGGYSDWSAINFSVQEGAIGYVPYQEGIQALHRPVFNKPPVGESYIDPDFYSAVSRVSESSLMGSMSGISVVKNDYSRIQVENADGSKILVLALHPDEGLLSYALADPDGNNLEFIEFPDDSPTTRSWMHDESEARWHPTDPDIIRFIAGQNYYIGTLELFEYRVSTGEVTVLADLRGKLPASWGNNLYGMTHFEGGASADGNRYIWSVEGGKNGKPKGFVIFDVREGGVVLGTLDYKKHKHDNVGISHSGRYAVISGEDETAAYSIDFSEKRVLMNEGQHGDLCRLTNGNDCYVSVSFDDVNNANYGKVFFTDLVTGEVTTLFDVFDLGNTSVHFSGRAYDVPGWVLVSTYNCYVGDTALTSTSLCDRIILVELAANPKIYNIAWAQSSGFQYLAEPHASISRDGERIYFSSDWYDEVAIDLYRVDVNRAVYGETQSVATVTAAPTALSPAGQSARAAGANGLLKWSVPTLDGVTGFTIDILYSSSEKHVFRKVLMDTSACASSGLCQFSLDVTDLPETNEVQTWRIQSHGLQDSSNWSGLDFQLYGKPQAPLISAPLAGQEFSLDEPITVKWTLDSHNVSTRYDVYLYDQEAKEYASQSRIKVSELCDADGNCQYTIPVALVETSYTVLLRARNSLGFSEWDKFTVVAVDTDRVLPPEVSLLLPVANSTLEIGTLLTTSWTQGASENSKSVATSFDVYVVNRVSQVKIENTGISASEVCDENGLCQFIHASELSESSYTVQVRARNVLGVSAWSKRNFTIVDSGRVLPPKVSIALPLNNTTISLGESLVFNWDVPAAHNTQSEATSFEVYVLDRASKLQSKYTGLAAEVICDEAGLCQYEWPVALQESSFTVGVRSRNSLGVSAWVKANVSVVDSSRVLPPVVSVQLPVANASHVLGEELHIHWSRGLAENTSSVGSSFDLYIYNPESLEIIKEQPVDAAAHCDDQGQCSYISLAVLNESSYVIMLRSRNALGVSAWTRTAFKAVNAELNLPPAVSIVLPAANAVIVQNETLAIHWLRGEAENALSVATGFDVYLYDRFAVLDGQNTSATKIVHRAKNLSVLDSCDASGLCQYTLQDTLPTSRYTAMIRAKNDLGNSLWSRHFFDIASP